VTDDLLPSGRRLLASATPRVSIIICAYERFDLTIACLESVAAHTPEEIGYETILVDDASSDRRISELSSLGGLRVVSHESNRGFLHSANDGAAAARGEWLFFLNNDALVTKGWLPPLLQAGTIPDVGAVGAKLVYPDGSLQEAGAVLFSDASAWNLGRGGDPSAAAYNTLREVDYCSGAALLVRRELFIERGGFDPTFAPGYYEEVDLCLDLRRRGLRILYEPRSVVIHEEGGTFGSDDRPGVATHSKSAQYLNKLRLLAKWGTVLEGQHRPDSPLARFGVRDPRRVNVLVCDHKVPEPDADSGSQRMWWILRLLRELGCAVTLYPSAGARTAGYRRALLEIGVEVLDHKRGLEHFIGPLSGLYDLVIVSRPDVAAEVRDAISRRLPNAVVLYDSVDIHGLRELRELETTGVPVTAERRRRLLRTVQLEESAILNSDLVATVTEDEARKLRERWPGLQTVVLPNVHEVSAEPVPGHPGRSGLLFIGAYTHPPNIDGVTWFVSEIYSRIRALVSEPPPLTLLGSRPTAAVRALRGPNIAVPGYLPDVTPYFESARVFVSPLRYGAGMKGKIGQALALGLPVVTTSIGAEGMDLTDEVDVLIADDAPRFAECVIGLYEDPVLWERLSRRGREIVAERWSPRSMAKRLQPLLADSVPPLRRRSRLGVGRPEAPTAEAPTAEAPTAEAPTAGPSTPQSSPDQAWVPFYVTPPLGETATFRCNICGSSSQTALEELERETPSCPSCESTVRFRSIIHALSIGLFGSSLALTDFGVHKELVGYGFSDWDGYAVPLAGQLSYVNTFYDRPPKLDLLARLPFELRRRANFVICSDVLEHVPPPPERAIETLYELLRPGGIALCTVPATTFAETIEHFPELSEFSICEREGKHVLLNRRTDGTTEEFTDLVFHGGSGLTLEMRVFSQRHFEQLLAGVGFTEVTYFGDAVPEWGIPGAVAGGVVLARR